MKELTESEIKALAWAPGDRFGLVNKENRELEVTSMSEYYCKSILAKIRQGHPRYGKLQLVKRPV